ncbi:MAG: S8/S53 family peptidase [Acidobacteria bacterium]|nr:S8/S53 family peptidase [Acidobacteriota bacterium]
MKKSFLFAIIISSLLIFINNSGVASTENRLSKKVFVPSQARLKSSMPTNMMVSGTLHFQLKNEPELDVLLKEQQDSNSANYRKWLTPTEFGEKFGVSEATYQKTINYLKESGITLTQTWSNRLRLDFQAPVETVQKAFKIEMHLFELEGKTYYGHLEKALLPTNLIPEIADLRLNNFLFTQPTLKPESLIMPAFSDQSGRISIGPQDIHVAYNFKPLFSSGIEGNGQSIGIIARSDFNMSDVDLFRNLFKLPTTTITKIPAGGEIIDRGGIETLEVLLDTQLSGAAAPKADIKVVIADRNNDIDQSLAFFLNNLPNTKVLSISFGACEKFLFPQFEALFNNLYKQAAAQGQSILVSSGDQGVNDCGDGQSLQVNALAASPFVTAVGGTSLRVNFDSNGNATDYLGEQGWIGSGGGVSNFFPITDYQSSAGIFLQGRTVPDVALLADPSQPGFFVVRDGFTTVTGGTSASTPVWAGIFALTNQFSESKGLGNANPRIYNLGQQQQMSASPLRGFFNDITSGNNNGGGLIGYMAQPGYDLCTGWGTPNTDRFVRSFISAPNRQTGLFLLFPNGSEILGKNETIPIRWQLSDDLVNRAGTQDILLSTDEGKTFNIIASNLPPTIRSFDYVANIVTTTARFRIQVRTLANNVIDTSDANVNIGTSLRIDFARYAILNNRLEVLGEALSDKAKLFVNNVRIDRQGKKLSTGELVFKGKEKKLKLQKGENFIVLEVDGVRSAPYKLFL